MWGALAPNSCKKANQKRIVISKLYANFKQFFFLDLRTEDHQLRMKTDRLYNVKRYT